MLNSRWALHLAVAGAVTIGCSGAFLLGIRFPRIAYIAAIAAGAGGVEIALYAGRSSTPGSRKAMGRQEVKDVVKEGLVEALQDTPVGLSEETVAAIAAVMNAHPTPIYQEPIDVPVQPTESDRPGSGSMEPPASNLDSILESLAAPAYDPWNAQATNGSGGASNGFDSGAAHHWPG